MEKFEEILIQTGLGKNEGKVYYSLLGLGSATIAGIAQTANIHRPVVYKAISMLLSKGLVTRTSKGKRYYYVAESPEKLGVLLETAKNNLAEIIPQLQSLQRTSEEKPTVKFLDGAKGIKYVFEDLGNSLEREEIFYRYSSSLDAQKTERYLPEHYRELVDKKQIEGYVITNELIAREMRKNLYREIRVMPKNSGLFDYGITEIIYGKKVAFIDYKSETALLIENKQIAEFQKAIFKTLYKIL